MSDVGASPLAPLVGGGTVPGVVTCAAYAAGRRVADLEVTEVDSVSEALLLEANLIKRFKPRFNIRLKDD